jgi:hypothetical protein
MFNNSDTIASSNKDTSKLSNTRPLDVLEDAFAATLKNDLPNVISRGDLLIEIKAVLGRGKWLPWLAEKFALSESTAQNYMNAARFAEKYPIVRDLKFGPGVLYWLVARDDKLTPGQLKVVFDIAKERWIGIEDASRAAVGRSEPRRSALDRRPNGSSESLSGNDDLAGSADMNQVSNPTMPHHEALSVEAGPPIAPEQQEERQPPPNASATPQGVAAFLDGFDRAMQMMLAYVSKPTSSFLSAAYAPATSASDIEKVGKFLQRIADAIKERAVEKVT